MGSWLFTFRPDTQSKLRLFCFPHAGGGPQAYSKWKQTLPASVELGLVQFPGRGSRFNEPLATSLPNLVASLARGLKPYFDKPFAFFGHSLGALLAFELARQVRKEFGILPLHLFASGRGAPRKPPLLPAIHALPKNEFVEELRHFNGTPKEVLETPELLELLVPILRADFSMNETYEYRPEPLLTTPITAFGGLQDSSTNQEVLEAWKEETTSGFSLVMFPGDHFFLHSPRVPFTSVLSRELMQVVRRATLS
jgi:medium-chain acyl-[acyl-carrier-protein] hydrolase